LHGSGIGQEGGEMLLQRGAGQGQAGQAEQVPAVGAGTRSGGDDQGTVAQFAQAGGEGGDAALDPGGLVGVVREQDEGDVHRVSPVVGGVGAVPRTGRRPMPGETMPGGTSLAWAHSAYWAREW